MKLVVTIPAYNEEGSIGKVIKEVPKKIPGIENVEVLVVDDGSTDSTAKVAKACGAIVLEKKHSGLAQTFKVGLEEALRMGADIIVNTDADFQYNQREIPKIIKPILDKEADVVLTDRQVLKLKHMPIGKRYGNALSTIVTRIVSGYKVKDAQSGFRAFSREAALKLNVLSDYTYVQETIIQAVDKKLKIVQVPCEFRKRAGKSRLISNIFGYAKKAGRTIIVGYLSYKPLKVFLSIGLIFFILGILSGLRVLLHFLQTGLVSPFIPTAILTAILLIFGFQIIVIGLLAEMIKENRKLNEEILYKIKSRQYN